MTEFRTAEVEALRRNNKELNATLGEFMQPEGASNVIESWIGGMTAPSRAQVVLLLALRTVAKEEGWL